MDDSNTDRSRLMAEARAAIDDLHKPGDYLGAPVKTALAHGLTDDEAFIVVSAWRSAHGKATDRARFDTIAGRIRQENAERAKESGLPPSLSDIAAGPSFSNPSIAIPSACKQLNNLVSGFRRRNTFMVLAPPGSMKTAWTIWQALELNDRGIPVLMIQLEIDAEEIVARVVANREGGISAAAVLEHRFPYEASQRVAKGATKIHVLELVPGDEAALGKIREAITAIRAKYDAAPVVFIDFLQLLGIGSDDNQVTVLGAAAYALKALAREEDLAIVIVSSVSRAFYRPPEPAADGTEDPRDWLAAGKGSGDIEFAAGTLCFLEMGEQDEYGTALARLIVAKARHGRRGFVGYIVEGLSGQFRAHPEAVEKMRDARAGAKEKRVQEAAAKVRVVVLEILKAGPRKLNDLKDEVSTRAGVSKHRAGACVDNMLAGGSIREVQAPSADTTPRRGVAPRWIGLANDRATTDTKGE